MISEGLILDSLASSALVQPFKVLFVAIRADEAFGDGSCGNPFRGNTAADFDQVMAELNPNTLVVLGPGLFRTFGYQAWKMTSGVTIVGSGMFNTTLRLILNPPVLWERFGGHAIQGPGSSVVLDTPGVAVMDMTIDCNLSGQLPYNTSQPYPRVAVGAIQLNGSNIRVQRVRVINFGTRTPIIDAGVDKSHDSFEDFPIFTTFNNQSMAGNSCQRPMARRRGKHRTWSQMRRIGCLEYEDPFFAFSSFGCDNTIRSWARYDSDRFALWTGGPKWEFQ